MSPQVNALAGMIVSAKTGDAKSLKLLRKIVKEIASADEMPAYDVIDLAECMVRIGIRASESQARTN